MLVKTLVIDAPVRQNLTAYMHSVRSNQQSHHIFYSPSLASEVMMSVCLSVGCKPSYKTRPYSGERRYLLQTIITDLVIYLYVLSDAFTKLEAI